MTPAPEDERAHPLSVAAFELNPALFDSSNFRQVDGALWSTFADEHPGDYDRKAKAYDAAVGMELYNRLFWGVSRHRYQEFAIEAAAANPGLPLVDLGCGTLRFTAEAYCSVDRPVVAVDASLSMLRLAQKAAGPDSETTFLQADARDTELRPGVFGVVCLFGMLHLFHDPAPILQEARRLLAPGGVLFASSVVTGQRAFSDRYRSLLERSREMGPGRRVSELQPIFEASGFKAEARTEGAFAFVRATV
ncbi:class I SAM-dependent methyltransferase [bacterium]|nr:MAG: class I SAM-dependent methyltransferase [bacterium]